MTDQTTPQSEPILDLPTAVREMGALPMPAGNEPKARTMLDHAREALNARMTKDDLRLVLENTIVYAATLETDREANDREYETATARIAELEASPVGGGYPPALPWARLMDREDLAEFLLELGQAAVDHDDVVQALGAVESAIATWRLIGEAQHAHNTAPGPDAETGGAK